MRGTCHAINFIWFCGITTYVAWLLSSPAWFHTGFSGLEGKMSSLVTERGGGGGTGT